MRYRVVNLGQAISPPFNDFAEWRDSFTAWCEASSSVPTAPLGSLFHGPVMSASPNGRGLG